MNLLRVLALICFMAPSSAILAERELPNFEIALGGGPAIGVELFNLDFTINVPVFSYFTAQLNMDSRYFFGDGDLKNYAISEFNGMGFIRVKEGRIGAGVGTLQKKSKTGAFETEQDQVVRTSAALYVKDVTISWNYAEYSEDFERMASLRAGAIWYPSDTQRVALFRERFDSSEGWRLETFVQPEKYRQHLALGAVIRDGHADMLPYMGLELRYYFDKGMSFKERERRYY